MAPPVFRSQRRSLTTPDRPDEYRLAGRWSSPEHTTAAVGRRGAWWRRPPRRAVVLAAAVAAGTALLLGLLLMQHMAVAAPAGGRPAASVVPTTISGGETLAVLPWGSGEGEVGRSSPQQGLDRGPEALTVAPDGRIAVLDSVNRRVVALTADGMPCGSFKVPLSNPRYLAASNSRVAVLDPDDSRRVIVATWSGEVLEELEVPADDQPATGVFLENEQVWMEMGHSHCLRLSGEDGAQETKEARTGRPVGTGANAVWIAARLEAGGGALVEEAGESRAAIAASATHAGPQMGPASAAPVRAEAKLGLPLEHLVAVAADQRDRMHIGGRMADGRQEPHLAVARFAAGALRGNRAQALPDAGTTQTGYGQVVPTSLLLFAEASGPYLGAPFIIAPDGRVLQPVGDAAAYRILVHRFPEEG